MFVDLQVFLNYSDIFCSNAYFPPNYSRILSPGDLGEAQASLLLATQAHPVLHHPQWPGNMFLNRSMERFLNQNMLNRAAFLSVLCNLLNPAQNWKLLSSISIHILFWLSHIIDNQFCWASKSKSPSSLWFTILKTTYPFSTATLLTVSVLV